RPLPGTLGSLRPPLLNLLLFVLTAASAFVAGGLLTDTQLPPPTQAEAVRHGIAFSAALLAILLSHEMGHFLLARRHGVDATWPFFIPAPLLSLIGTLGAVIRLRSTPRTRRALVAIAGWFGLLLTALNLLPLGQLDGGHCLYAASPRVHRLVGAPCSALLLALGVFTPFFGWAVWGLITGMFLNQHPPVRDSEPHLSPGRRLVLIASLIIFILSFAPVPLAPLAG